MIDPVDADTNRYYEMQDVPCDREHLIERRAKDLVEDSICDFDDILTDALLDCEYLKEMIRLKPISGDLKAVDAINRTELMNKFLKELDSRLYRVQKPFAEEEYDNGDL